MVGSHAQSHTHTVRSYVTLTQKYVKQLGRAAAVGGRLWHRVQSSTINIALLIYYCSVIQQAATGNRPLSLCVCVRSLGAVG